MKKVSPGTSGSRHAASPPAPTDDELRKLLLNKGRIPADVLTSALQDRRHAILPNWLIDALINELNPAKRGRGRPRIRDAELNEGYVNSLVYDYNELRLWLQQREDSVGLRGWSSIRQKDWWQGPPSERAARILAARLTRDGRPMDYRRFQTIISEYRSGKLLHDK